MSIEGNFLYYEVLNNSSNRDSFNEYIEDGNSNLIDYMLTVSYHSSEIVKILSNEIGLVNQYNKSTALMHYLNNNIKPNLEIMYLLKNEIYKVDKYGRNALMYYMSNPRTNYIDINIINFLYSLIGKIDKDGNTALYYCIYYNKLTKEILDILYVEISILSVKKNETILMEYVKHRDIDIDIINILSPLLRNININGQTTLMIYLIYNVENPNIEVIKALSSEIGIQNKYGETALMKYITQCINHIELDNLNREYYNSMEIKPNLDIIKILYKEIPLVNNKGETALFKYLNNKYYNTNNKKDINIIKALYTNNSIINYKKETSLIYYIIHNNFINKDIVKLLSNNIGYIDNTNTSALVHYLIKNRDPDPEIIKLLIDEKSIKVDGKYPLYYYLNNTEIDSELEDTFNELNFIKDRDGKSLNDHYKYRYNPDTEIINLLRN